MPRTLTRLVALLLIPCLVAGPLAASVNGFVQPAHTTPAPTIYNDQALAPSIALIRKPFQSLVTAAVILAISASLTTSRIHAQAPARPDSSAQSVERLSSPLQQAEAYIELARQSIALGDDRQAENYLKRAAEADRLTPTPYILLGDLETRRNNPSAAARSYREALDREPQARDRERQTLLARYAIRSVRLDSGFDVRRVDGLDVTVQDPARPSIRMTFADQTGYQLSAPAEAQAGKPLEVTDLTGREKLLSPVEAEVLAEGLGYVLTGQVLRAERADEYAAIRVVRERLALYLATGPRAPDVSPGYRAALIERVRAIQNRIRQFTDNSVDYYSDIPASLVEVWKERAVLLQRIGPLSDPEVVEVLGLNEAIKARLYREFQVIVDGSMDPRFLEYLHQLLSALPPGHRMLRAYLARKGGPVFDPKQVFNPSGRGGLPDFYFGASQAWIDDSRPLASKVDDVSKDVLTAAREFLVYKDQRWHLRVYRTRLPSVDYQDVPVTLADGQLNADELKRAVDTAAADRLQGPAQGLNAFPRKSLADLGPFPSGAPPVIRSFNDLLRVTADPFPAATPYVLYQIDGPYTIYYLRFASAEIFRDRYRVSLTQGNPARAVSDDVLARTIDLASFIKMYEYFQSPRVPFRSHLQEGQKALHLFLTLEKANVIQLTSRGKEVPVKPGALVAIAPERDGTVDPIVVSHELIHALYLLEPQFRQGVNRLWDSLTPGARKAFEQVLFRTVSENGRIDRARLKNEFAAYGGDPGFYAANLGDKISSEERDRIVNSLLALQRQFLPFIQQPAAPDEPLKPAGMIWKDGPANMFDYWKGQRDLLRREYETEKALRTPDLETTLDWLSTNIEAAEKGMLRAIREAGPVEQPHLAPIYDVLRRLFDGRGALSRGFKALYAHGDVKRVEEDFLELHRKTGEDGKAAGKVLVGETWEEWNEERHAKPLSDLFREVVEAMYVSFATAVEEVVEIHGPRFWIDLAKKVNKAGADAHSNANEENFKAGLAVGMVPPEEGDVQVYFSKEIPQPAKPYLSQWIRSKYKSGSYFVGIGLSHGAEMKESLSLLVFTQAEIDRFSAGAAVLEESDDAKNAPPEDTRLAKGDHVRSWLGGIEGVIEEIEGGKARLKESKTWIGLGLLEKLPPEAPSHHDSRGDVTTRHLGYGAYRALEWAPEAVRGGLGAGMVRGRQQAGPRNRRVLASS